MPVNPPTKLIVGKLSIPAQHRNAAGEFCCGSRRRLTFEVAFLKFLIHRPLKQTLARSALLHRDQCLELVFRSVLFAGCPILFARLHAFKCFASVSPDPHETLVTAKAQIGRFDRS